MSHPNNSGPDGRQDAVTPAVDGAGQPEDAPTPERVTFTGTEPTEQERQAAMGQPNAQNAASSQPNVQAAQTQNFQQSPSASTGEATGTPAQTYLHTRSIFGNPHVEEQPKPPSPFAPGSEWQPTSVPAFPLTQQKPEQPLGLRSVGKGALGQTVFDGRGGNGGSIFGSSQVSPPAFLRNCSIIRL